MKVAFVNPKSPFLNKAMNPPLSLCFLYTEMMVYGGEPFKALWCDRDLGDPIPLADKYFITCTSPQWRDAKYIAKVVGPDKCIIGGPHAEAVPESILSLGAELGKPFKLRTIPFRRGFGFPDRYQRTMGGRKAAHIVTLQGCPFKCNFCCKCAKVEYRELSLAFEEMEMLNRLHGITDFVVYDDIITLDKDRFDKFCIFMIDHNYKWRCWTRADMMNLDIAKAMKESGVQSVTLGVESGSQKILDNINKKVTVDQNYNALIACKSAGLPVRCSLMFGNPGETKETLKETLDMVSQCQPDEWNLAVLKPIPGSEFWLHPEEHGLIFDKQKIIDDDYACLNRFDESGVGDIVCHFPHTPKEDLELMLRSFVTDLEGVCPRKDIQDGKQEIKI